MSVVPDNATLCACRIERGPPPMENRLQSLGPKGWLDCERCLGRGWYMPDRLITAHQARELRRQVEGADPLEHARKRLVAGALFAAGFFILGGAVGFAVAVGFLLGVAAG